MRRALTYAFIVTVLACIVVGCGGGGSSDFVPIPPEVSSVTPTSGGMGGYTRVTIFGEGLANDGVGVNDVHFGNRPASGIVVVSDTEITCLSPSAGTTGSVTVSVTKNSGTGSLANGYTYNLAPSLVSVVPPQGTRLGGQERVLNGTGFQAEGAGETSIDFGGYPVLSFTIESDTVVTLLTPTSFLEGKVDVHLTNGNGTATLVGGYTFSGDPPVLTSITPTKGSSAGGTFVRLDGQYFTPKALEHFVTFGGIASTDVQIVQDPLGTPPSEYYLTCTTPPHAGGEVNVTVSNLNGASTLTDAFEYVSAPTITDVSPIVGSSGGGDLVTIEGTGFANFGAGTNTVTFGSSDATAVTLDASTPDTTLTCLTPAGSVGFTSVTLSNNNGVATWAGQYEYVFRCGWDTSLGSQITRGDEDSQFESFHANFTFPYAGNNYTGVYISGNGALTFDGAFSTGDPGLYSGGAQISAVQADLDPTSGGTIWLKTLPDRTVVTWNAIPAKNSGGSNTFQVILNSTGEFCCMWSSLDVFNFAQMHVLMSRTGATPVPVDWSAEPSFTGVDVPYEFFQGSFDLNGNGLHFTPNSDSGFDCESFTLN